MKPGIFTCCFAALVLAVLIGHGRADAEDSSVGGDAAAAMDHAHHAAVGGATASPTTGTPLDFFTNGGAYMPRTHCLVNEAGSPDWFWIGTLIGLTVLVMAGYVRIFVFWRRAYLDEEPEDRNRKMMQLAYIFLFCAVCGYGFALLMYVWPAYRLLAVFMVALNVFTWKFALNLNDFRVSLSARRLQRELEEELRGRNELLEQQVLERTAALAAIQEETQRLATVASATDNVVVLMDAGGVVTWVNESCTRVSGFSSKEILGRHKLDVLRSAQAETGVIERVREHLDSRRPLQQQIQKHTRDGRPYWLSLEIRPVHDDGGGLIGFMSIESDISELKQAEQDMDEAREAAESASESKSRFLANMSHEIRTPLTGVIGFAQMLEQKPDADEATRQDWARTIHHSARHLQSLLNDVLDVSKIEAGRMEMEWQPVDLHGLLADTASNFRVAAAEKGITLDLMCPNPLPQKVRTDPTRLRQVLSNLVSNAIKFTGHGGVHIEADLLETESGDDAQTLVRIDVVDTGPGIPADRQAAVFRPFVQADNSVSREHGGTGLGLVISRRLCEALGGTLTLESRQGFGSRFTVTFNPGDIANTPRVTSQEAMAHARNHVSTASTEAALGAKVLVADDGETNRKFLQIVLADAGCDVVLAEHGAEAVELVKQTEGGFDLILMDMQMPVLDGYRATAALREAGVACPILALTASTMQGTREKCTEAGCTGYLTKPIDPGRLIDAVREAIEATRAGTATNADAPVDEDDVPATADPRMAALVNSYLHELENYLKDAEAALNRGDLEAVAAVGHKVLGSGGTIGFHELTAPAAALETAAKTGQAEAARRSLDELVALQRSLTEGRDGDGTAYASAA